MKQTLNVVVALMNVWQEWEYNLTGTLSNEFQLNQKMKDDFGPISVHCEYVHLDVTDKVSFLLKYSFLSYYHFKAFLPEKNSISIELFPHCCRPTWQKSGKLSSMTHKCLLKCKNCNNNNLRETKVFLNFYETTFSKFLCLIAMLSKMFWVCKNEKVNKNKKEQTKNKCLCKFVNIFSWNKNLFRKKTCLYARLVFFISVWVVHDL